MTGTPLPVQLPPLSSSKKRVVIGESFRLSRQTDGLLLAGPETVEKTKAKLARRAETRHIDPPAPPKLKLKTQKRDPSCAHNFFNERRPAGKMPFITLLVGRPGFQLGGVLINRVGSAAAS
jgi:hypothetical protein